MSQIKVAVVFHSGYGHTALLAEAVQQGASQVAGVSVALLTAEQALERMDDLDDADAIVFGSPTYMGSASGPMTTFMDATSKSWHSQKWRDKIAGGFTNSGSMSGDKLITLQQFVALAAQHGMIWVSLGLENETAGSDLPAGDPAGINRMGGYLGAMGQSENAAPGPDNPSRGDVETARRYGMRIAKAAERWGKGRLD